MQPQFILGVLPLLSPNLVVWLFFLSNFPKGWSQWLFQGEKSSPNASSYSHSLSHFLLDLLPWTPLLNQSWTFKLNDNLSKEEQLLRERMRIGATGISSFQFDEESSLLLFPFSGSLFIGFVTEVCAPFGCTFPPVVLNPSKIPFFFFFLFFSSTLVFLLYS